MKRTFLLLALLAVSICAQAQTNYPSGIPGCIARWNFCSNGTINTLPDVSGNGNGGSVFNLSATSGFRGGPGTAMSFDGSTSYALVSHNSMLTPQNLTIVSLVKFTGWYSGSCQLSQIISKGYPYFIPGHYALGVGDNTFDGDCNTFSPNNMMTDVQLANLTWNLNPGNYFSLNQWYFYAATFEANSLKIYIVPMNTTGHVNNITPTYSVTTSNGTIGANTQDISIGKHLNPTHPYWFNGDMDELTLFNRALSTNEIQSVYDYLWKVITIAPVSSNLCRGSNINVNYTVNTPTFFSTGNVFTVQLSDASGSFATPVTIGTLASVTSGSIPCTIPAGTPAGSGYRIRIVANNAAYIAENENCSSSITISATTVASPVASSNSPVCEGGTLNLTASSIPGATYTWSGPGGYSANIQNPFRLNVTPAAAGVYQVIAKVGSCSSAASPVTVVVSAAPAMPIATSNSPVCIGATLQLSASGTPGASYSWTGPNGFTSTQQNPTIPNITAAGAGTYSVTAMLNGCTSQAGTTVVTLNNSAAPMLGIFPSPNDSVCAGSMVTFIAVASNVGTSPQFQWMKNGNIITGANAATYQTNNITTGDYFSCEVINNSACPVPPVLSSNNVAMTIIPPSPAQVSITADPGLVLSPWQNVTFTAHPINGGFSPTYQWLRNGQKVIGAISGTWSANNLWANDAISVVLYSSDPCAVPDSATSNILVVNVKTGISSANSAEYHLAVYPNPNKGDFNIRGRSASMATSLEVINSVGQCIYRKEVEAKNGEINEEIHLTQQVASGVYILRLTSDKTTENYRFIVDK